MRRRPERRATDRGLGAISYMDKRMGDAILCGAIDVPTELDKGED